MAHMAHMTQPIFLFFSFMPCVPCLPCFLCWECGTHAGNCRSIRHRYPSVFRSRNPFAVITAKAGAMQFTPEQLARIANCFRSSLFQRQHLYYFLCPGEKRVRSRLVFYRIEDPRALPADAVLIGRYDWPIHEREFIADLVEVASPLPEPAPEACAGICAGPPIPKARKCAPNRTASAFALHGARHIHCCRDEAPRGPHNLSTFHFLHRTCAFACGSAKLEGGVWPAQRYPFR